MRVISTVIKRGNTIPATYKLKPMAKDIVQYASSALSEVSPDINVGYSQVIEDLIYHVLESDEILYQIDKEAYTLKDLIKGPLAKKENDVKNTVLENMESCIDEVIEEHKMNFEAEWEQDFEDEEYDGDFDEFVQEKIDEYKDSSEYEEDLKSKIHEEIEIKFGSYFDILEIFDSKKCGELEDFIEAAIDKNQMSLDNWLIDIANALLQKEKYRSLSIQSVYLNNDSEMMKMLMDFRKEIEPFYIELWLLRKKLKKEYDDQVFKNVNIDVDAIVREEARKFEGLNKFLKLVAIEEKYPKGKVKSE